MNEKKTMKSPLATTKQLLNFYTISGQLTTLRELQFPSSSLFKVHRALSISIHFYPTQVLLLLVSRNKIIKRKSFWLRETKGRHTLCKAKSYTINWYAEFTPLIQVGGFGGDLTLVNYCVSRLSRCVASLQHKHEHWQQVTGSIGSDSAGGGVCGVTWKQR